MNMFDLLQIVIYFSVLLFTAYPLGIYMARVFSGQENLLSPLLKPLERWIYKIGGINSDKEMTWIEYAISLTSLSGLSFVFLYLFQRLQGIFPIGSAELEGVPPYLAFNTAVSFISNTNWQAYAGESSLHFITQMLGLTVQNFISAAVGIAILVAVTRAFGRTKSKAIGNFWVDFSRSILYVLLPLSTILAMILVSQGVVQSFNPVVVYEPLQPQTQSVQTGSSPSSMTIGPVASQIAIKQLGTNGGGYYGANSAVPFENPTPFSNFLEMLSILLIPAALCITFGAMVKDMRQGWAIVIAMLVLLALFLGVILYAENNSNPLLNRAGASPTEGNMEGKEVRFGIVNSAIWSTATTAASNGSVNAMHDSAMPLSGFSMLVLMLLGEVVFGGVGSGLYGMLCFIVVAVFTAGLMVGRTPEYLGKKIEPFEMKMASLVVLIMPLIVLGLTGVAVLLPEGKNAVTNPGSHGFSQVLYAFASQGNNNGSAFAGLSVNTPFYNFFGGLAMLIGRFWLAIPVLAMAGSLAQKKIVPPSPGTLPTHTPLFVTWLICIVLIVGALNFFPALALGPIIEHLLISGL